MPTLEDGIRAAEEGNTQQARLIFQSLVQENPRDEAVWMELANVMTDVADKRTCYENVLKINKDNREAREALRSLEPQANPFVMDLGKPAPDEEYDDDLYDDEDAYEDEEPSSDDYEAAPVGEPGDTPVAVLVGAGLALSVVVFAIGGGLVFWLITTAVGS